MALRTSSETLACERHLLGIMQLEMAKSQHSRTRWIVGKLSSICTSSRNLEERARAVVRALRSRSLLIVAQHHSGDRECDGKLNPLSQLLRMRVMYSHMSAASYTLNPLPNFGAEVRCACG